MFNDIKIEFYYEESYIGTGYNLNPRQAEYVWNTWESYSDNHWCLEVIELNDEDYEMDDYEE